MRAGYDAVGQAERSQLKNPEPPPAGLEGKGLGVLQDEAVGTGEEVGVAIGDAVDDGGLAHDAAAR